MWREHHRGTTTRLIETVAAIAMWWALLESCPQLPATVLQIARVSVLYAIARG